ncbi:MAG: pyridoxamine 5'-phosphate oxidase family protein, partial [Desulfobacterales bacterium]|nr:pyridoxamine 5'-phosphate oxidase family protein [Desulfobacterales bacterium]
MRRKEKEITEKKEIEEIIRESTVCRLAMVDGEEPYVVPLNFGFKDGVLYFHSASQGRKIDILKSNPRVCFTFDVDVEILQGKEACEWGAKFRSVIGSGRAEFIRESQAKRDALDVIMAQYSDETFGSYEYPDKFLKMVAVIKV